MILPSTPTLGGRAMTTHRTPIIGFRARLEHPTEHRARRRARALPTVDFLEPRRLLSAVAGAVVRETSPFVQTFGNHGINLVHYRATQDGLASLMVAPGKFVVVGDTAAAGAHKA